MGNIGMVFRNTFVSNMDRTLLSRLGIHPQGIDVYLDLLKHGSSFLSEISGRTGFERTVLYRRLPELLETGVVEREVMGKRFRYTAAHPSAFSALLKTMDDALVTTISELERTFRRRSGSSVPKVRVMHGPNASVALYTEVAEILPKNGIYFRYSSRAEKRDKIGNLGAYHRLRDEKRIERMVITNEDLAKIATEKVGRDLVALPAPFPFKQNFQKIIYADRVAIVDIETDTVCVIESALLASFEEAIFRCLFNFLRAKKEGRV